MNSSLPVYRGEIQCRMLGMAIEAYSEEGKRLSSGEAGELVCERPFPCQPLGFWPLEGFGNEEEVKKAEKRYQEAYFSQFKGVWCEFFLWRYSFICLTGYFTVHGDHVRIMPSREGNAGGVIVLGRSDGVLWVSVWMRSTAVFDLFVLTKKSRRSKVITRDMYLTFIGAEHDHSIIA
jgi:acetoacetyl-CoA synthetase